MQIKIRVRPTQGYHYPGRIDHIQIDSSARLETIQEKCSTQGSTTRLYYGQHELPLNSSIGSHNFDDDAIIECCRSPGLSAALSACLKDLDAVKKLRAADRNRVNLMRILQTPLHIQNDPEHEIWQPSSWTNDSVKSRTINFAIMKSVLQRQDRYQVHDLPRCNDCQSLYDALQAHNVWTGGSNGRKKSGHNSQAHIFKPQKKSTGLPTTNWILLDAKLEIQQQIKTEFIYDISSPHDYLEEFVIRDHSRHETATSTPNKRKKSASTANQLQDDSELYLAYLPNTPPRSAAASASQRSPSRGSTLQSSSPARSNSTPSTPRSRPYMPEYASGPFAVLATLHLAMHSKHKLLKGRKLTLTEGELKRSAQPSCRSNLYDKMRIRGRNAFACMDGLIEKQLVRKEIVRDTSASHLEIEKWGLLPDGETLGQYCAEFDRAVRQVIPKEKIGAGTSGKSMNVVLCMDTREDVHYSERIKSSCEDEKVPFVEKELPAGDYLFLEESSASDEIVPLVIERKSWPDLADSCHGKGNARNRLDCVRLDQGSASMRCAGNCQLCKMKRCGCTQIMFIVEGERCKGLPQNELCTVNNCCSACKLLSERHGTTQLELEGVLTRLQLEHGCHIHYTKNFNDTIDSLFCIRRLLQKSVAHSSTLLEQVRGVSSLSYELYKANARSCSQNDAVYQCLQTKLDTIHEWDTHALISIVHDNNWDASTVELLLCLDQQSDSVQPRKRARCERGLKRSEEPISLDSDSDDDSVVEVVANPQRKQSETICLDSDSDDSVIEVSAANKLNESDDSIIILDDKPEAAASVSRRNDREGKPPKSRAHHMTAHISMHHATHEASKSILVLHHLNKYEVRFGKIIDKMWKETCSSAGGDLYQFYDKSLERLNDSSEISSLVHGRTVAAFALWLQVIMGVQIRFVEGGNVTSELRCKLRSNAVAGDLVDSTARTENSTARPSQSDKITSASSNQWSSSKVYSTPPKSNSNYRTAETTGPKSMPMNIQGLSSSKNDAIREARLRRFDQPSRTVKIHNTSFGIDASSLPNTWGCTRCTLDNELSVKNCAACGNPRDSSSVTNSGLQILDGPSDYLPSKTTNGFADNMTSTNSGWKCDKCTYQNEQSVATCAMCQKPSESASKNNKSTSRKRQRHTHANEPWICEGCASENRKKDKSCFDCGALNRDHPDFGSDFRAPHQFDFGSDFRVPEQFNFGQETSASLPSATKKKIKCGACSREGHNRSSATASNCSAFYNDEEVERRERKEQRKLAEMEQTRQNIERLEREGEQAERLHQEWVAKTEEMKRNNAQAEEYRNDALKRAQDKMKRLQKRKR